jgi:hypothetical protein
MAIDDDDGVKHQPNIQGVRIHGHVATGSIFP